MIPGLSKNLTLKEVYADNNHQLQNSYLSLELPWSYFPSCVNKKGRQRKKNELESEHTMHFLNL